MSTGWPTLLVGIIMSGCVYLTKYLLLQMDIGLDTIDGLLALILVGAVRYMGFFNISRLSYQYYSAGSLLMTRIAPALGWSPI